MEDLIIILLFIGVPVFLGYRGFKKKLLKKQNELGSILFPKTCLLCGRNLEDSFAPRHLKITAVCNKCASDLPKQLKKEYVAAQKKGLKDDMLKLLQVAKEKQDQLAQNCNQCGKNFEKVSRDTVISALCSECVLDLPKKVKKELKKAVKNSKEGDVIKLLQIAKEGVSVPPLEAKQINYEYKGGHPDFAEFRKMALTDTTDGIIVFDTEYSLLEGQKIYFTIEWDKITSISADSETITKGNKALSTLGVLSGRSDYLIAGVASRSSKTTNFLNIGYKELIETVISFEGKDVKEAAAYYINAMTKYVRQEGIENDQLLKTE